MLRLSMVLLVFSSFLLNAGPLTVLQIAGSPQSYVVGNQFATYTPSDGYTFTVGVSSGGNTIDFEVDAFNNTSLQNASWWYLYFEAPLGQALTVGYYANATRWPFQAANAPGLSLFGDGRGDNQSSGYFDILELEYAAGGTLASFAADFTQFDENSPVAVSSGSIRFNSDVPLPTTAPEPTTLSLLIASSAGFTGLLMKRGKNSFIAKSAQHYRPSSKV